MATPRLEPVVTDSLVSLVGYGLLILAGGFAVGMGAAHLTNKLWDKYVPVPIEHPIAKLERATIPNALMP